jgi:hypothetical protein
MRSVARFAALLALAASVPGASGAAVAAGRHFGPGRTEPVRHRAFWHKPFAKPGFAFGGNSGVFAESPDRIFVAQRGEFKMPDPVPPGFVGFAGSIGVNVLTAVDRRVWQNCLYTLDANGKVKELWTQWDKLCEGSFRPGPASPENQPVRSGAPRLGRERNLQHDLHLLE